MILRILAVSFMLALICAACGDDTAAVIDGSPPPPPIDAAPPPPDAPPPPAPDAALGITGAACSNDLQCVGGTCLGLPGGPAETDRRFAGGYCTNLDCTLGESTGCDPGAWCTSGGPTGAFCVELCSNGASMCERPDYVCLRVGSTRGGCYNSAAVECDPIAATGCDLSDVCLRTGFIDPSLGRCETPCDLMRQDCPDPAAACYYSRLYDMPFCTPQGAGGPDDSCTCDHCCGVGLACTPDLVGTGRHCKDTCRVSGGGCAGGTCQPLEADAAYGGCVLPGSAGSM